MAKNGLKIAYKSLKRPKIGKKKTQFSLDDSLHTSNLPIKVEKCAKFTWNDLKMTKKHLETGWNGQKPLKNLLKVPEKGLKLAKKKPIILHMTSNSDKNFI